MKNLLMGAMLAGCALAVPQLAAAQKAVNEAEVTALALYAMPLAFDGLHDACGEQLPADAYVLANAMELQDRFEVAAEGSFPQARRALFAMGGSGDSGMPVEMMEAMGEAELGPFMSALIRQMVASEMDAESCDMANRVLEYLDPLPPENLAGLLGFIISEEMSSRGNED